LSGTLCRCRHQVKEIPIPADKICGIHHYREIDIHLVVRIAFVVKFFRNVSDQNCFRLKLCKKGVDDAVIDGRKLLANLRAIQYVADPGELVGL